MAISICWVFFGTVAVLTTSAWSKESNFLDNPPPPVHLDANLRRALLKALTELENEEVGQSFGPTATNHNVEKVAATAVDVYTHGNNSNSNSTSKTTTTTTTFKPLVVIQKSDGIQSSSQHFFPDPFLTSESATPNKLSKKEITSPNSIPSSDKFLNSFQKSTTTTTTLAPPVTPENEAKVEDVQFFTAPLVAAFTVHQDERGLPHTVIPLFSTINTVAQDRIKAHILEERKRIEQQQRNELLLKQKQESLEVEIQRLKQEQELQQRLLQQQRFEFQNHGFPPSAPPPLLPTSPEAIPFRPANTIVHFQSSIPFQHSLPDRYLETQKLPLNEYVNFHPTASIRSQALHQQQQQQRDFNAFQPNTRPTRFFRQETGVFNAGLNRQQRPFFTQQFVFRPDRSQLRPLINDKLSQLLFSSGVIGEAAHDDLHIVSKVLALDHERDKFRSYRPLSNELIPPF